LSRDHPQVRALAPFWYMLLTAPSGIGLGFVSVTVAPTLKTHGVGVGAIATLLALTTLPSTLRFLIGPAIDLSLTTLRWVWITMVGIVAGIAVIAVTPLGPQTMPLLDLLGLLLGIAVNAKSCAVAAAMAETSPIGDRGRIAGWANVGSLGGAAIGGGAGLWIAVHLGGVIVAGAVLAAACVICILPILWLRTPPVHQGESLVARAGDVGRAIVQLMRTRAGVLVAVASVIPCSLGAAAGLFPVVAGDWRASPDMVALYTGVLTGVATAPGCILGGFLCDRFPRRVVYIWAGVAYAVTLTLMAFAPHTPAWFAAMVLVNAFTLGIGYAAIQAVIYECLGDVGAATINAVLGSVVNIPVVAMTVVVGRVQADHGSNAMLLIKAVAGFVSIAGYAALAWLWKPAAAGDPPAALAEA
jgi:PAT family beta-lactamase induction signal transducer AmpG